MNPKLITNRCIIQHGPEFPEVLPIDIHMTVTPNWHPNGSQLITTSLQNHFFKWSRYNAIDRTNLEDTSNAWAHKQTHLHPILWDNTTDWQYTSVVNTDMSDKARLRDAKLLDDNIRNLYILGESRNMPFSACIFEDKVPSVIHLRTQRGHHLSLDTLDDAELWTCTLIELNVAVPWPVLQGEDLYIVLPH